ncbi:DNase I-like protein [Phlegmacium glaucopus]|nr:DNase I-like protein [Phlegmacium glaucopus]
MALNSQIQNLLKSPDEVKVVLEATFVTTAESDSRRDLQDRRILAVVSHKDDWNLTEEGTLFVYKYKQPRNGRPEELDIQTVLPIYGEFSIVMSQMRRGTLDLRPTLSPTSVLDQPRAVLSLSVTPAEGLSNEGQPPTFLTHDIQTLRSLVRECKRLKQVVDLEIGADTVIDLAQSTTHFSWLKPYLAKGSTIASLASLTQDLRQVNRPLLDRLSPAYAGLSGDDHSDVELLRDEWIRTKARERSRKGQTRLTLRIGTFNVNGKMPSQDLSAWIQGNTPFSPSLPPLQDLSPMSLGGILRNPFDWTSRKSTSHEEQEKIPLRVDTDDPDDPDIFVLGIQELDLSTEALIYYASTVREDAWCHAIFAALGEKAIKYEKLASRQLVGMLIVVLVKKSLRSQFGNVKTSTAGSGILGIMGNKGGTAIRLSFTPSIQSPSEKEAYSVGSPSPTTLTFVNAHLAAFDEMAERRNSDFHDLSRRLNFDNDDIPPQPPGSEGENISPGQNMDSIGTEPGSQPSLSVYETDVLFWMVNLNYRMDVPDHEMRKTLREDGWENGTKFEALLRFDQLKKAIQSKRAFEGFQEAPITHTPTYRFSPGLAMDSMGYDLKRKPAWTDRILYMRGLTCRVHQLSYTSHPQIIMSDHRPVSADFTVDADTYDTEELHDNVRTLFNQVDDLQSDHVNDRGELTIENTVLDFGGISHDKLVERKFNVKNTATSSRAFRFVSIKVDSPIHPEWLHIHPMTGVLLPNEIIQITVRAYIDNAMALILNRGPTDLSATLILHTVLGKDHFISVSGEYRYTCFANQLSRLTRLRGPIRSMTSPNDLLPENHPRNAPREFMRLVNWMMSCTLNTDAMFLSPANEVTVNTIRECLDTGDEFPYSPSTRDPELPLAFAITLLRFLESLAEPIVPVSLHPQCLEMSNRDEAFESSCGYLIFCFHFFFLDGDAQLLDALPPASVNVWISITAFLHFICKSSQDENHAERIAAVLAPVLMRDDPLSPTLPISPKSKCKFLLYFIS